jgi:N-acetylmuramoyl-L-alanine amidase
MAEIIEIIVIAGHGGVDKGARCATLDGHTWFEYELTIMTRELLCYYLEISRPDYPDLKYKVIKDDDSLTLQGVVNWLGNIYKDKTKRIIFDIHFDAFNKTATGTTTFIPDIHSSLEKELGSKVSETSSRILGIPNRGCRVESRSARKKLAIMRPQGENVLYEVCFGDNPLDLRAFLDNSTNLVIGVAKDILDTVKKLNNN